MESLGKYRALLLSVVGILALVATVASSAPGGPRQATQADSDVSVSMTADQSTLRFGQSITYTITMTNLGPGDATFVDVAFAMPEALQALAINCDLGISPDGPFCEYSSLPSGATVVSTLVATPRTGAPLHMRLMTASASVLFEEAESLDPNTANNSAFVRTKLIGRLPKP